VYASVIHGYAIEASDGRLGTVSDFLFEDTSWMIRWLVVDTGHWLSGRKVLLPPSALEQPDAGRRQFPVKLTMQQVKDSPDVDTDRPVSRQLESNIYNHYAWDPYWSSGYMLGAMAGRFPRRRSCPARGRAIWLGSSMHGQMKIRISAASKRSPGTIFMPPTATLVMSRTSLWTMPAGASDMLPSIPGTGGPERKS
jgi:hypothetical protein